MLTTSLINYNYYNKVSVKYFLTLFRSTVLSNAGRIVIIIVVRINNYFLTDVCIKNIDAILENNYSMTKPSFVLRKEYFFG